MGTLQRHGGLNGGATQIRDSDASLAPVTGQAEAADVHHEISALDFYHSNGPDLLAKCSDFFDYVTELRQEGTYQTLYRVELTSGLDHVITVRDPDAGREAEKICFDSNSYLGLHLHPRVIDAVKMALDRVGFGTPSAQVLGGTNHYLRELEETVATFHGKEEAIIFPSGYSANIGVLGALLRKNDFVFTDRFSHASIHDGIRWSDTRNRRVFPHRDMEKLEGLLSQAREKNGCCGGKLIATDGVFSMHGTLAPLKDLRSVATRHGALLLVDEAHATGVIGRTGRGLEEHFGMNGAIDVLVGTFSKAPGGAGGYVCGSKELICYLQFFARSGLFTATLPAALCAGLSEAYRVMDEEPEHRERLWHNVNDLAPRLAEAGLAVPEHVESPIITVYLGSSGLLRRFSREVFAAGIKCGSVTYPAVPRGEAVMRLAVNARHTREDLDRTVSAFAEVGKRYGILYRNQEEIREIGDRIP
jgi:8-amino-7-oxononanoate synthase